MAKDEDKGGRRVRFSPEAQSGGAGPLAEKRGLVVNAGEPDGGRDRAKRTRRAFWLITLGIVLSVWLAQFSTLTLVRLIRLSHEDLDFLLPRAVVSSAGFLISLAILFIQRSLRHSALWARALAALALAIAGSAAHAAVSEYVFAVIVSGSSFTFREYALGIFDTLWIYGSLSAIVLALTYGADIKEKEDRINALQILAQSAQLRALRNQLNPHFLFNTLNSIAGLISRGRNREAESMTESLADFLRTTLVLDPHKQITLAEEIELQKLYLEIEKTRFPRRLSVTLHIPEQLKLALVPSLITQPLVENSIKYAVARSTSTVQLEIAASATDEELTLTIQDSGGNADAAPPGGARVGLSNVMERLHVHYGSKARFEAYERPEGGFCNRIVVPLRMAA